MKKAIKIGNAQAFWGDDPDAAISLLKGEPDIDYLTFDYLSEVSLSIMAIQKEKDPNAGFAKDFIEVIKQIIPFWKNGRGVKIIANAGGLNPRACAMACLEALETASCLGINVGIVTGDDVLEILQSDSKNHLYQHMETCESLTCVQSFLATANAYLGAKPMADLLLQGASIVITGRVADPSLTLAPCVAHFGWKWNDYDKLAQATIAGHLIECGTQVAGGIFTDWLMLPQLDEIGFPFVEMEETADFVVTKPKTTGGAVSIATVKEQLLYEMGNPANYISPDVCVSILGVKLEEVEKNRVKVTGAIGSCPPTTYKVSATYKDGFKAEATLALFGDNVREKALKCADVIIEKVKRSGFNLERTCVEVLGTGDLVPGIFINNEAKECVLRICVADHHHLALECFVRHIAPMVTAGAPGTTGYTSGRAKIREIFGFWPCLISTKLVSPKIEIIEAKS